MHPILDIASGISSRCDRPMDSSWNECCCRHSRPVKTTGLTAASKLMSKKSAKSMRALQAYAPGCRVLTSAHTRQVLPFIPSPTSILQGQRIPKCQMSVHIGNFDFFVPGQQHGVNRQKDRHPKHHLKMLQFGFIASRCARGTAATLSARLLTFLLKERARNTAQ